MTTATEDKATEAMVLHEVRDGGARITLASGSRQRAGA